MNTEIAYILDRSGSMSGSIWQDAINGLKEYIKEQQAIPSPCKFTLVGFDNAYDLVIDAKDLKEVDPGCEAISALRAEILRKVV